MCYHKTNLLTKFLKITVWNIQGLKSKPFENKLNDKHFISAINNADIVCLTETHENDTSNLEISGYSKVASVKRPKNKIKSSGGIAIFVKQNLVGAISPVNNFTNTDIIWIKLKKEYFKETTDFFLGTVYFSPENYEKKYKKDYITQLEYEINHFKSKGEVIIQGDFNARVGNEKDIITHSKYFDHDNFTTDINTNSQNTYPRNSYDNTVNTRGTDLLDLCIASDLNNLSYEKNYV